MFSSTGIYVFEDDKDNASTVTSDLHMNIPKKILFQQLRFYGIDSGAVLFQQNWMTS
jgi:hypothetical protein